MAAITNCSNSERKNSVNEYCCCCQSLSHFQLFMTTQTAALQASLSFTMSQSLLKLMCIESEMPSTHLVLCRPLLLLHSIFPSIRVFSESALHIRWSQLGDHIIFPPKWYTPEIKRGNNNSPEITTRQIKSTTLV